MDKDLLFLQQIGLTVVFNLTWIVPLVAYRWFRGRPITAQGPPPDFRQFKLRALFVLGIGLSGGFGVAGILTPPFRPILPSIFCIAIAALSLTLFIVADRGCFNYDD